MRVAALALLSVTMTGSPASAETAPVLSFSRVAFSFPSALEPMAPDAQFGSNDNRGGDFSLGSPEGSGFRDKPVKRVAAGEPTRMAQRRTKRAFVMPWMSGVYQ